jgi:hypothetical protein
MHGMRTRKMMNMSGRREVRDVMGAMIMRVEGKIDVVSHKLATMSNRNLLE